MANIAEVNGTMYTDIAEAVKAAKDGETVKLLNNIESNIDIWISNAIILDLNEKTWKFGADYLIGVLGNGVIIKNGTITQTKGSEQYSVVQVGTTNIGTNKPVLTTENVKISGDTGIIVMGAPSVVNIDAGSEISGIHFGIATNGKDSGTTINVNGGTVVGPDTSCGIYLPSGTLNINGGKIQGGSGVVIRGGYLTMSEGTVISTGTDNIEVGDSGVGLPPAGISIDKNVKYNSGNVSVSITGGKVEGGENAIVYTDNGVKSEETTIQGVEITGGVFSGNVLNSSFDSTGYLYDLIEEKSNDLNERIDTAYETMESFADDVIKLKEKNTSIEESVSKLETTTGSHTEQLGNLDSTVNNLNGTVDKLGTTVDDLSSSLSETSGVLGAVDGKVTSLTEKVNSTDETISGLSDKVTGLEGRLDVTDEKVSTLETNYDGLDGRITKVEGDYTTTSEKVSDIEGRLETAEGSISTMTEKLGDVDELKSDMDTVKSDINGNKTEIDTVKGNINTLQSTVDTMQEDVDTLKSDMESVKGDVESVHTNMDTVTNDISDAKTDITGIKDDIEGIKTDAASTKSDVDGLTTDLDGVKTNVTELQGSVDNMSSLETTVAEIQQNVDEIKKELESEDPYDGILDRFDDLEKVLNQMKEVVDALQKEEEEKTKPIAMPPGVIEAMVERILIRCKNYMDAKLPVSSDTESVEDLVARLDERYVHQDDIL